MHPLGSTCRLCKWHCWQKKLLNQENKDKRIRRFSFAEAPGKVLAVVLRTENK